MPIPSEINNRVSVVIITGGSSGIGSALIKAIYKLQERVVVCNLSRNKPDFFLGDSFCHIPTDLRDASAVGEASVVLEAILDEAPEGELVLINNSGFGDYGPMDQLDREKQLGMMDLNMRALVDLTLRLLPRLKERGGSVVNIASTAAFQPTPGMTTYGATKAFVLHWTLALAEDLQGSGVHALAVCPGPTRSNFFRAAGFERPPLEGGLNRWFDMSAEDVAERTLVALARRRRLVVTGWKNRLIAALGGFSPKVASTRLAGWALHRLRLEQYKK
ncbi:MAG: SDR family NAD(P)-dependent oxidoreductase [Coraliomargaritaceae bacterium]